MKEPKKYSSPAAMRTALEEHINRTARETNQDIQRLRRQVAFDRFLAEELAGNQWLDFAGISAPKIPAISAEQQFAEKIHSYSLPRQTPNSRTKDLADLVLLIEKCSLDTPRLRDAIEKTFNRRKTHEVPRELANPPETWKERFKNMAEECGIPNDLDSAINKVRKFYNTLF